MSDAFDYQGFGAIANWSGALNSTMAKDAYATMAGMGSNAVSLSTKLFMSSATGSDFLTDAAKSVSDATIVAGIKAAQAQGLKVILKPHALTLDGVPGSQFAPKDVNAFFQNYKAQLVHLATIAQANGVDTLSLGNEMSSLTGSAYRSQWSDLIDSVRKVYSGKLTYAAAGYEANTVSFWDKLDVIGVNAYPTLSAGKDPTVADMVKAWTSVPTDSYQASLSGGQSIIDMMKSLAGAYGKKVLVTEVGFRSIDGAATDPGQWYRSGTADQTDQANAYKAMFQVFASQGGSWLSGLLAWGANIDGNPATFATDYSVAGKSAANVVKQYFTGAGTLEGLKVAGSAGSDVVDIGAGNDTVATGLGNDTILAGAGDDVVNAGVATIAPNQTTTVTLTGFGAGGQVAVLVNGQQVGSPATFTAASDPSGYQTYTFTFANPAQINSLDIQLLNGGSGGTAMIRSFTINGAVVKGADVANKFRAGTLELVNGSIHLDAGSKREWFYGAQSDDDTIQGGAGDDTIDGGAGVDTAVYAGNLADYAITRSGDSLIVADSKAGRDGTDTLKNVEFLRFGDGTLAVASLLVPDPAPAAVSRMAVGAGTQVSGLMKSTILTTALAAGNAGATLAIAGVSAAGATVTLSSDGKVVGQATADRSGAFKVSTGGLASGIYRMTTSAVLGALGSPASDAAVAVIGTSSAILGLIASSPTTPAAVLVTDPANAVVGTVDQVSRASWGLAKSATPLTLGIADTAANVSAALGYLATLTNLGSITLTDGGAVAVASVKDIAGLVAGSGAVLAKIVGGYTFQTAEAGSNGNWVTRSYDAKGAQLSTTVTSATATGKTVYTTFTDGSSGQKIFDSKGQLTSDLMRNADGSREQYDYGITGQPYASDHMVWDKTGKSTLVARFDSAGRLCSNLVSAADGTGTLDAYTAGVLATRTVTKATGAQEVRTFDAAGRMTLDLFRNADGTRDQYEYGITGKPYTSGHLIYDKTGLVVQALRYLADGSLYNDTKTAADGATTVDAYTAGALATRTVTKATGAQEVQTFDAAGRMTSDLFRNADGTRDQYDYGITGKPYTSDHLVFDKAGRVVEVQRYLSNGSLYNDTKTAADGTTTEDAYTAGALATRTITKATGAQEVRTFDAAGRMTSDLFRNADGTRDQYDYGITGKPYTSDHLVYDKAGRVVEVQRYLADGSLYNDTKTAADGATTVDAYTAGVLVTRTVTQSNGAQEVKTFGANKAMVSDLFRNADGTRDQYDYGITGKPYTSDHLVYDKAGKLIQALRYVAGGGLYSDTTVAADNTETARAYDTAGRILTQTITRTTGAQEVQTFGAGGAMVSDLFRNADGSRDQYDYGITGQPYVSDHVIWNSAGKQIETLRYRTGGGLYSDTSTAADNTVTTVIYDATGRRTQQTTSSVSGAGENTNYDSSGAAASRTIVEASGAKHFTTNGITGQPYTSMTVNVDAAGNKQSIVQQNTDGSQTTQMYASGVTMAFDHAVDKITSFGGDTFQFAATPFKSTIQNFQGGSGTGHDTVVLSKALANDFSKLALATSGQTTTVTIDSQHSLIFAKPVGQLVAADFRFV